MLSNTKHMPLSHAITHAKGGSDEITPASIGETSATGTHSLKIISSGYAGGTIPEGTKEASCLYN